jgi:hypothetical protein
VARILVPLALLLLLVTQVIGPWEIRRQLVKAVEAGCASCTLQVGSVGFSLLPVSVTLGGVDLLGGNREITEVRLRIRRLRAVIAPSWLVSRRLHLKEVEVEEPEVTVVEGDRLAPPGGPPGKPDPTQWDFSVARTEISGGRFHYFREHAGQRAPLRVGSIRGTISELGSTRELRRSKSHARIRAVLEKSGQVDLDVRALVFGSEPDPEIDLKVGGLNLSELNPYFQTDDGIALQGTLREGHALVAMLGRKVHASVQADYEDLNVSFAKKNGIRSGAGAFFSNLAASVKIDHANTDEGAREQHRSVDIEREPRETLLKVILRGMKKAAMKVISS